MDIKPIKTETDYGTVLSEIEHLWGAPLGTPDGDKLDVLATLIEAYEQKHHPINPPHPVEVIKFRMDQLGSN